MLQFILMLLGLAFSHNNANATTCNNNQDPVTIQSGGPSNPGGGVDPGNPGDTGGDTGQTPPRK
ncbi:hypothetical protein [Chryseobacterium polytrichastri]|uniref:Uncharacterized protein n=1 Tax=Chryseobacterium polytrichastri TaxID=1302687 RepID=A0A1M6ZAY9_9FLAO|nr:hypothetical protein [Chryseobacterium polytrichastri]SHL27577.1 hypothetical protein SAMN05444267_101528 [Chryseobacterium polytrichastri]